MSATEQDQEQEPRAPGWQGGGATPTQAYVAIQNTLGESFEQRHRARNLGIAYAILAVLTAAIFTQRGGSATFGLDEGRTLGVAAQPVAWLVAGMLAALAGAQLWRGFGRWQNAILAVVTVSFLFSFLAWAAAGRQFAFVGMLQQAVTFSTPLIFGALAGILCERSGVINIAIEGLLLNGAFTATLVGSVTTFWLGVGAAMATGALLALLLAWLAIRFKVDQVIVGFFINFFVLGVTSFLDSRILVENQGYNDVDTLRPWRIPLLQDIPVIGDILFEQTVYVYAAFASVAVLAWALFRTRWGLRTRAVGEHPRAADTLGVDVNRQRYRNVVLAGAVAGFGGSWWPATVGKFNENITGGRGFIALAVVIVGRWHPVGALCAALVFGFFSALQDKLSFLRTGIPGEFIDMTPYLATIVVVCGFIGKARAPKAAGQPYESQ